MDTVAGLIFVPPFKPSNFAAIRGWATPKNDNHSLRICQIVQFADETVEVSMRGRIREISPLGKLNLTLSKINHGHFVEILNSLDGRENRMVINFAGFPTLIVPKELTA
jgi:hypothetical protein